MTKVLFALIVIIILWLSYRSFNKEKPAKVQATSNVKKITHVVDELPNFETEYSVYEAYSAIPHRRTVFYSDSSIEEDENYYLSTIFDTIDQAIVLRVTALNLFNNGYFDKNNMKKDYQNLQGYLNSLDPPPKLKSFHNLIFQSVSLQGEFLQDWQMEGTDFQYDGSGLTRSPRVKRASSKLRQAYSILMRNFPSASSSNKNAFFDYLCALDFI